MQIILERKVPFRISLYISTHDLESHSALTDLTKDQIVDIETKLALILSELELLMFTRRDELDKF